MADLALVFDLLARDNASPALNGIGDAADGAGRKASGFGSLMGGALAGIAGVLSAGAIGKGLYEVGSTFDDLGDTIRVTTGETGAALDGLVDSAKLVGTQVPASFDEIGTTIADVNQRLGLTGPVLETLSSQILQAGNLLGTEVDVAGLSGAFSAFNVTGDQTTAVMDDLYRVSQATGVGINDLAAGVASGAPQLQEFGFSISESAALLGTLDKAGLNSDATIAALNKGMIKFAEAGKEPRKALDDTVTGIEQFIASGDRAAAIDLAAGIFGTKGAGQFVAAVESGSLALDDLMGASGLTSDTIMQAAGDTADFAEQWQLFKNEALLKLEPIATRVFSALGDGMQWFTTTGGPALSSFADVLVDKVGPAFDATATFVTDTLVPGIRDLFGWLADNQTTVTVIAGLIGGVLAAAFLVWGARTVTAAAQNTLAWFTTAASSQVGAATQQRSALQVVAGWILMGVQALLHGLKVAAVWTAQIVASAVVGAAGFLVQTGLVVGGWVLMGVQALLQGIKIAAVWTAQIVASAVVGAASFLVQTALVVGGWVLMGLQSLLQAGRMAAAWFIALGPVGWVIAAVVGLIALIVANWDTVVAATRAAWEWVTTKIGEAWTWIVHKVTGAASAVWEAITGAWDTVKTATSDAWTAVKDAVSTGITAVVEFVTGLPGKAVSALASLGSSLAEVARTAWGMFDRAVDTAVTAVITFVTGLPGKIASSIGNLGSTLYQKGRDLIDGLLSGAGSVLKNIGRFFLDLVPSWIRGPFESALGIASPSKVFAGYGVNIGEGLLQGIGAMRPAIAEELAHLADTQAADMLVNAGVTGSGGGLGYRAPRYDDADGITPAAGGDTYNTTLNAAPNMPTEDQLATLYRRQRLLQPRRGS